HFVWFLSSRPTPTAHSSLSLHDALPISQGRVLADHDAELAGRGVDDGAGVALGEDEAVGGGVVRVVRGVAHRRVHEDGDDVAEGDRKSTRLNSSHVAISYAVFCLKKKKK